MTLSRTEQRWVAVVGHALIPGEVYAGARRDIEIGPAVAGYLDRSASATVLLVRLGLLLVWLSPVWLRGRARTFGGVSADEREALLEALLLSDVFLVRQLAELLKFVLCMVFLGHEPLLRRLRAYDLDRPPRGEAAGG